jgi:hypothetical protein
MFLPHRLPRISTRFGQAAGDNVFAAQAGSTGLGIAFNLAVMIFGGFVQLFVTWLIEARGSSMAPAFYVMFGSAIGAVAAFFLVDRAVDVRVPTLETVPSSGPNDH